ncbi:hypothetical protein QBA54_07670 [Streptomyces sp. B21-108]|jgi:hypothetical protein|uniref:hypothetical protein n=1 Tax=Streptomyces sp. B21-108 TaxID=3039419 RepID=UPI002FEFE11F
MNDRIHAGVSALSVSFVGAVALVRWAVTGGRGAHRGPRAPRRIEVEVRGRDLIPALADGWPATAFRYCVGCRTDVPVAVHDGAHSCERGHVNIHTTTAGGLQ